MLMNVTHDTKAEHRKLAFSGIAVIVVTALLIALSIGIYQKRFTKVTWVTVMAKNAGLQLNKFGDVRMHGVLVGQVREVSQDGSQAVIKVALEPDQATGIPSNVGVEIVPTTLFGQKFMAFTDPDVASPDPIRNGDVIGSERVSTNVELQAILSELFPLLRSIRPEDLNSTLYAIASALDGRGEKIGETVETLDDYLKNINVHLPTIEKDIELFAEVADVYAVATPDIVRLLKNATVTANTVSSQASDLDLLFKDMSTLSTVSARFLRENEKALKTELALARPLTRLLDTYSPQNACLLESLSQQSDALGQVFRGNTVRQYMNLDATQFKAYTKEDRPTNGEAGSNSPECYGIPNPEMPFKGTRLRNGYRLVESREAR